MDTNSEASHSSSWRRLRIEKQQKFKGKKASQTRFPTKRKQQKRILTEDHENENKKMVEDFINQIEEVGITLSKQISYDNKINDQAPQQQQSKNNKAKIFGLVSENIEESIEIIEGKQHGLEQKDVDYQGLEESFVQRLKIGDQNLIQETLREDELSEFSSQHRKYNLNKLLQSNKNYASKIFKYGKIIKSLLQQLKKQVVTIKQQAKYHKKQFQLFCMLAPIDLNQFMKHVSYLLLYRNQTSEFGGKVQDLVQQIQEKQREISYLNFKISQLKNENNELNEKIFDFNQKVIQTDLLIQQKVNQKLTEIVEKKFKNVQSPNLMNETKQFLFVDKKFNQADKYQGLKLIGNVFQNLHTTTQQEERKSRQKSFGDNSISKFYKTIYLNENSKILQPMKNHSKQKQKIQHQSKGMQQSQIHKKSLVLNKRLGLKISVDDMDSLVHNCPQQSSIPQSMWNHNYLQSQPISSTLCVTSGLNDIPRPLASPKYKAQTPKNNSSRLNPDSYFPKPKLAHVKSQPYPFQPYQQTNLNTHQLQKSKYASAVRQTYRNINSSNTNHSSVRNHVIFSKGFHAADVRDILDASSHGRRNGGSRDRDWSKGKCKQHSISRQLRFKNEDKINQLGSKIDELRNQIQREIKATHK